MSKYKIEANEDVYIRSLDERLSRGDKIKVDSPTDTVLSELDKCDEIGLIRYVELVEKRVDTYPHDEDEFEDTKSKLSDYSGSVDEFIEDNENYYCKICGRNHYTDSSIGVEHLKSILEDKKIK